MSLLIISFAVFVVRLCAVWSSKCIYPILPVSVYLLDGVGQKQEMKMKEEKRMMLDIILSSTWFWPFSLKDFSKPEGSAHRMLNLPCV